VKQFVRQVDDSFDERKFGFTGMVDALRYGQREGLFRLDRDRQGVVRVYPGLRYPKPGGGASQPSDAAGEHEPAIDHAEPADGEAFVRSGGVNDVHEPDADTGTGEHNDAEVEAVTYDVVTHVDADSGVIDVARHEDATAGPTESDAQLGGTPVDETGVQAPGRGQKARRTPGSRSRGRRPRAAKPGGPTAPVEKPRAAEAAPGGQVKPGGETKPGGEAKPGGARRRGGSASGAAPSRRRKKAPVGETPAK
jgi:hypothetical protein